MHRHIVYPGQIPLDTDFLSSVKDSYYGAGWLAESAIGVNTQVVGLAVTPTSPASLQVNVAPGAIYSLQTVDSAAYGALGTDANQFTKQGILAAGTTLTITPPGTVGQSINYLVQVAFAETDGNPVILPYYNASNPSVAWSGPNNTGVAQNTVRTDTCVIGLKAGAPAATGSQITPNPDVGYTGIYVVTVAQGQTTITGGNISQLASAPYFPTLPQVPTGVQNGQWVFGAAGGTANALTATLSPIPTALSAGLVVNLIIATTNTGAATLNLNGLGIKTIVRPNGDSLVQGDLLAGRMRTFIYDGTNFQLAASPQSTVGGFATYNTPGSFTFTVPTGITRLKVYLWGAGGGGGGSNAAGAAGSAGANGGYCEGYFLVTPGQSIAVAIGTGGSGGNAATPSNGAVGGATSFGALCSSTGGGGGGTGFGAVYSGAFATGGVASGAAINIGGGIGGYGFTLTGTSSAGGSAQGDYGRPGGSIATGAGAPGIFPGGGGGGGANNTSGGNGGAGANGFVIVEY